MQKKTRRFERTAASVCKEYAILTLATLVMSAGTYLFKFPNNFSFGSGAECCFTAVCGNVQFYHQYGTAGAGISVSGERLWRKDGVYQRSDVCGTVCGRKAVSHVRTAD